MNVEQHWRKEAAGVSLIAGPGLVLAGWSIFPSIESDQAAFVADIAAEPTRAAFGAALTVAGMALSIVAYFALMHLSREREPLLSQLGGALAVIGGVFVTALMGVVVAEVEVIRQGGAGTVALIEAIDESAAMIVLLVSPIVLTVGLITLAVALYRARTVPALPALLLGVGAPFQLVGFVAFESLAMGIAGFAAMFVATAIIGYRILAEADEVWEHVPQISRFHAARPA